jgi:hypothetical protein
LGRLPVLSDRTWFGNIIRGHPEVGEHRGLAEATVQSPDELRLSRSSPDCRLYFGQGPRGGRRMIVVADVVVGVVKTAHLCERVSGGPVEWSR